MPNSLIKSICLAAALVNLVNAVPNYGPSTSSTCTEYHPKSVSCTHSSTSTKAPCPTSTRTSSSSISKSSSSVSKSSSTSSKTSCTSSKTSSTSSKTSSTSSKPSSTNSKTSSTSSKISGTAPVSKSSSTSSKSSSTPTSTSSSKTSSATTMITSTLRTTTSMSSSAAPSLCNQIPSITGSLASTASSVCSSFLGIGTTTVYTTLTQSSPTTTYQTITTGTDTITAPVITASDIITADPITTSAVTLTVTAPPNTITTCLNAKRSAPLLTATTKSCSIPGIPSSAASLVCSCLQLTSATYTSTVTATVTPTVMSTVDVGATATTTPITTIVTTPVVIPTVTMTTTPTVTQVFCTPAPTPDTSCNNAGLEFAHFYNDQGVNGDGIYSQFDSSEFASVQPDHTGIAYSVGGIGGNCGGGVGTYTAYGYTFSCEYFALMYRGYLYAAQAGQYVIAVSQADDILNVWFNDPAKRGFTRGNAYVDVTYSQLNNDAGGTAYYSYVAATPGQYIPFRILFAQGDGPFGFDMTMRAPDGTVILSDSSSSNAFLVQYSCDGTTAPAYSAPFGNE